MNTTDGKDNQKTLDGCGVVASIVMLQQNIGTQEVHGVLNDYRKEIVSDEICKSLDIAFPTDGCQQKFLGLGEVLGCHSLLTFLFSG